MLRLGTPVSGHGSALRRSGEDRMRRSDQITRPAIRAAMTSVSSTSMVLPILASGIALVKGNPYSCSQRPTKPNQLPAPIKPIQLRGGAVHGRVVASSTAATNRSTSSGVVSNAVIHRTSPVLSSHT